MRNWKSMKVIKKTTLGQFAKPKEDFADGDILEIVDSGIEQEGEFGIQRIFKIEIPGGEEKNLSFNQTSINHLIDVYGGETEEWVGKKVKAWIIKQNVSGKFRDVVYLTGPEQELEGLKD